MSSTTIRVTQETQKIVRDLSETYGISMQEVVARAIEKYRREKILAEANAGYAALRADPEAWREWREELAEWDVTLLDGLEDR